MYIKSTILLISSLLICLYALCQNTYVPDDNFEQALIDLGYDTAPLNDSVPTANISNVESLTIDRKNIADLTGISSFTLLKGLSCVNNKLTSLDISANKQLQSLYCSINKISELDVSGNTELYILAFARNTISQIDLTKNINLSTLSCSGNILQSLDIKANTKLRILYCNENQLDSLDVSNNSALTKLWCHENQLTSLNISANTSLTELRCYNNQIKLLDLSVNSELTYLNCRDNQLTILNIRNGNNDNITDFDVTNNPDLTCIQVDNPTAALANANWLKDETASYSEDCTTGKGINELLQEVSIYPNPVNNCLYLEFSCQNPSNLFTIEIYNTGGLLTLNKEVFPNNCKLNLENFLPGIYFVNISNPENGLQKTFKIIKQAKIQ